MISRAALALAAALSALSVLGASQAPASSPSLSACQATYCAREVSQSPYNVNSKYNSFPDQNDLCKILKSQIRRLPASTDLYEWPDKTVLGRLPQPAWRSADIHEHWDVVVQGIGFSSLNAPPVLTPAPVLQKAQANAAEAQINQMLKAQTIKLDYIEENVGKSGIAEIYRISIHAPSEGTLGSTLGNYNRKVTKYIYVISHISKDSQFHNWPVFPLHGSSYKLFQSPSGLIWVSLPAGLVDMYQFDPRFDVPGASFECVTNVGMGRK